MPTRRGFLRSSALAGVALPYFSTSALAQTDQYPTGPIRSICPLAVGSGADARVRFLMNKLSQMTGKPSIVENKPGALGNIATEYVARSKPDGYTIYVTPGSSTLASAPALFKKLNYDPLTDFEHITTLSSSAFVLCVTGDSPFQTVQDLTAHLKDKGEAASYGSIAPPGLVSSEIYKTQFGLKTVEVKYRETGGLFNDLFSGQLAFTHIDMTTIAGQLKSGKLRALHVTSAKRLAAAPHIPGAEEAGVPNMDVVTWWSVHVPARTPASICEKLETWFNTMVAEPDVIKFHTDVGGDMMPGNSKSLRELLIKQTELWKEYVRIARIEPE
jgi:tripartite-type tricarboxylate transporter receptor subunit TctC